IEEFRSQRRGGKGIILIDASERNGPVVAIALVKPEDEVMLVTDRAQTLRTRVSEIRETGRNAQGVRVMHVAEDERVVAIEGLGENDEEELEENDSQLVGVSAAEGDVVDGIAIDEPTGSDPDSDESSSDESSSDESS